MLKIYLRQGQRIWITSDSHYNHKNLCRGVTEWDLVARGDDSITRDFQTLEEFNDAIVNGINSVVRENDILIHLGDWSFGGFDSIREFRNRIVCKEIHLITGNHDHHIVKNKDNIQEIFTSVHEFYTQFEFKYYSALEKGITKKVDIILSHFPICSWENMNKGVIHLFGHVHLPPNKKIMPGRSMDVGADGNNYVPYSLFQCFKLLNDRPIKSSKLPSDHHVSPGKVKKFFRRLYNKIKKIL